MSDGIPLRADHIRWPSEQTGILNPLLAPWLTTVSMTTSRSLRERRKDFGHYFILPPVSFIEYVFLFDILPL